MKVYIGRIPSVRSTVGAMRPGDAFTGARTGRLFIMNDNGTFTHLETGKVTKVSSSNRNNGVYKQAVAVVRDGNE